MQRLLAIESDSQQLCFVAANAVGEQITLEASATIPLTAEDQGSSATPEEPGKELQAAIGRFKRSGTRVLVGIDRSAVELFKFTVPPATDSELVDLVLNQISTESPAAVDDAIIDFTIGPGPDKDSRKVTAAALAKTQHKRLNDICSVAGLSANRLLLRPYSIAALFSKCRPSHAATALLVDVSRLDIDLVVVEESQAVFFRSVKLPVAADQDAGRQRLLQEIRRTLLIAPQSGDVSGPIRHIVVFTTTQAHQELIQQLSSDHSVTAEIVDPLQSFELGDQWQTPGGSLGSLLGMLVVDASGVAPPIDFLQPKKAPRPVDQRRRILTAAAAVLFVAAIGQYFIWGRFAAADEEIKQLSEELKGVEKLIKKMADKKQVVESLEDWELGNIIWLDELRNLSTNLPPGQEIVLQRLNVSSGRAGKGSISFQGLAHHPNVITEMETRLRNERHEVQTPRVEERLQEKQLPWSFETAIGIAAVRPKTDNSSDDEPTTSKRQR